MPDANKPTTAIVHLPLMPHRPDVTTLAAVLPCLIAYVASGLRSECEPTASAVGHTPSTLVTADYPEGRVLVAKGDVGAGQLQLPRACVQ